MNSTAWYGASYSAAIGAWWRKTARWASEGTSAHGFANQRSHSGRGVAPADRAALRPTNPQLQALRQRYAGLPDIIGKSPIWRRGHVTAEDVLYFRGDNAYVWQFQDNNAPEKYLLTYLYLQTIDTLGLLDILTEDGDYGVFTFPTGDTDGNKRFVSRDLLDSVCELLFLERTLQISRRKRLADGTDFKPLLAEYGYRLCHDEPKYQNTEVQESGVSPAWYYLFRAT